MVKPSELVNMHRQRRHNYQSFKITRKHTLSCVDMYVYPNKYVYIYIRVEQRMLNLGACTQNCGYAEYIAIIVGLFLTLPL